MSSEDYSFKRLHFKKHPHTQLDAFRFAYEGIVYCIRTQRNFRIELVLAAVALGVSIWLRTGVATIVACIVSVLVLEMINTAIEATVDLFTDEYHPLARIAKDVAAGAVLVASLGAALIGAITLLPPLLEKLK
ncbi:diacylglycerol kinase family protein [Deinococcus roseus]|uniref:Diacylglycerol kinase n=1 Tax=Deinococcus roseus TaxID=392414 RepID=A0ABQ2CX87_9DEIO|nr:diacylglycerol kinase family protein [Deinococcus roseus]GGJ30185.1 diacylglycerol kinase [Deinococcus roseus]